MRILFAGIIGRYPWGGVTWCTLMYLIGLRRLGHDVWYLEDTGECNYDPQINAMATDPRYALNYIQESLEPFDLGDRWCYVDYQGQHHGPAAARWEEICQSADVFLVLSGGCWNWRDHYLSIPVKAFIDSDPAFTQTAIARAREGSPNNPKQQWYVDFFETYDKLFTFGQLIGQPECRVPDSGLTWLPTWQPICTDLWTPDSSPLPSRRTWTTIMTWKIESFTDIGGNKDEEFLKALTLSNQCRDAGGPPLELAVNGPQDFLREHGWRCVDAFAISSDIWRYHHYIGSSRGEFSVAKKTYVQAHSGWFSDRTACYLACGRPAVVQDTGFSRIMPAGNGLMAWNTVEEAFDALQTIEANYAHHATAARALACEHLSDSVILPALLSRLD